MRDHTYSYFSDLLRFGKTECRVHTSLRAAQGSANAEPINVKLVLVKPALTTQVHSDLRVFEYCIRRRRMLISLWRSPVRSV